MLINMRNELLSAPSFEFLQLIGTLYIDGLSILFLVRDFEVSLRGPYE